MASSSSSLAQQFGPRLALGEIHEGVDPETLGTARRRRVPTKTTTTSSVPESLFAHVDGNLWAKADDEETLLSSSSGLYERFVRHTSLPVLRRERPSTVAAKPTKARRQRASEALTSMLTAPDKPSLRKEAVELERTYDRAMRAVEGGGFVETIDRLAEANSRGEDDASEFGSDFLSYCTRVDTAFDERKALRSAVDEVEWMSKASWREAREALALSLFEHKWTNATCGALANQATVGCVEHGRLLDKLRRRTSMAFERVCRLQSDALWQLDAAVEELTACRRAKDDAIAANDGVVAALEAAHRDDVERLKEVHKKDLARRESVQREREDAACRASDMVRALNGVFRDMQQSSESTSKADLKDRVARLEEKLKAATAEVEELRSLRQVAARVPILEAEARLARDEIAHLRETLVEKDGIVADLSAREAIRLRDEELLEENDPRHKKKKQEQQQQQLTEEEEEEENDEGEIKISTLCAMCRKSLDDVANIRAAVEGDPEPPRLVCHGYRVLLPHLGGHRPSRPPTWVRRCARAILNGLLVDHALGRVPRMPEVTYAFFEPPRRELDALDVVERRRVVASADEDRWGLYYGVKLLAREADDEATLFWALLDETHGGDFLAFALYCLATIKQVAGEVLREQLGASWRATGSHSSLRTQVQGAESEARRLRGLVADATDDVWTRLASQEDHDALACGGQQSLWVHVDAAVEATERVLLNTNAKLRKGALDATRAIAVQADGRLAKWRRPEDDAAAAAAARDAAIECVDLALWMRVLTHLYREEQAHRRAVVRLMFETALAGTIAAHAPDYGTGREPPSATTHVKRLEPHEPPPAVDLPQFVSIVRTLYPTASTVLACFLFREAHAKAKGRVDYEAFIEIAEKFDFFAKALRLPQYVAAMPDLALPARDRHLLGAAVYVRAHLMRPVLDRVQDALPDESRSAFAAARDQLALAIGVATQKKNLLEDIDGIQPLVAYRRLLVELQRARMLSYELGRDFPQGSGEGGVAFRVAKGHLAPGDFVVACLREMRSLELVCTDFCEPPSWAAVERLQRSLAIGRLARAWRRRVCEEQGPPAAVRLRMRRGYVGGRGAVRSRRIYFSPARLLNLVALVYEERLLLDSTTKKIPFPHFVHASYLAKLGVPSVAERALHDLYLNARHFSGLLPRARLFFVFSGGGGGGGEKTLPPDDNNNKGSDPELDAILYAHNEAAVSFYVRAVLLLRDLVRETDDGPLWPVTRATGHGPSECEFWYAPIETLEAAVHDLFDDRLDPNSIELEEVLGDLNDLERQDSTDDVDVDAALDVYMRHWARAVRARQQTAVRVTETSAVLFCGAKLGLRTVSAFDTLRQALAIKSDVPPLDPGAEPEVLKATATQLAEGHLRLTQAYAESLRRAEGGAGVRLPLDKAAQTGLDQLSFHDMIGVISHHRKTTKKEPLIANIKAMVAQFFAVWDAYVPPIETYLDDLEAQFTQGTASDALEDARALAFKTTRAIEAYRVEVARNGLSRPCLQLRIILDKWALLRTYFDAVHHLRGIQVKQVAAQLKNGKLRPDEVKDPDLLPVPGWEPTWDFIRDDWSILSPDLVQPNMPE